MLAEGYGLNLGGRGWILCRCCRVCIPEFGLISAYFRHSPDAWCPPRPLRSNLWVILWLFFAGTGELALPREEQRGGGANLSPAFFRSIHINSIVLRGPPKSGP